MSKETDRVVIVTTVERVTVPTSGMAHIYAAVVNAEGSAYVEDWSPEEVGTEYSIKVTAEVESK